MKNIQSLQTRKTALLSSLCGIMALAATSQASAQSSPPITLEVPVSIQNMAQGLRGLKVDCRIYQGPIHVNGAVLGSGRATATLNSSQSFFNRRVRVQVPANSNAGFSGAGSYRCNLSVVVEGDPRYYTFSNRQNAEPIAVRTAPGRGTPVTEVTGRINTGQTNVRTGQMTIIQPTAGQHAGSRSTLQGEECKIDFTTDGNFTIHNLRNRNDFSCVAQISANERQNRSEQVLSYASPPYGLVCYVDRHQKLKLKEPDRDFTYFAAHFFKNGLKNGWKISRFEASGYDRKSNINGSEIRLERIATPADRTRRPINLKLSKIWIEKSGANCSNIRAVTEEAFGR